MPTQTETYTRTTDGPLVPGETVTVTTLRHAPGAEPEVASSRLLTYTGPAVSDWTGALMHAFTDEKGNASQTPQDQFRTPVQAMAEHVVARIRAYAAAHIPDPADAATFSALQEVCDANAFLEDVVPYDGSPENLELQSEVCDEVDRLLALQTA